MKRFTYWTSDGKRHWTPFLNIALNPSASAKFREADKLYNCRLHRSGPRSVGRPKSATHRVKGRARGNARARTRN
jgi:hypothetical protein